MQVVHNTEASQAIDICQGVPSQGHYTHRSETGQAIDVDESGNLVMQLDDNSYITMVSGDVTSHPLP